MSRTPLREALKVLASENLVVLLANRSAVVSGIELGACEEIYDVVAALEELAARLACERITDAEIATIVRLHGRMIRHHLRGEIAPYFELNQDIHLGIVRASRNPVLLETWERLRLRVRRAQFQSNLVLGERWAEAVREHEGLLTALTSRDGARLSALIRAHIRNGLAAIKTAVGPSNRPRPTDP